MNPHPGDGTETESVERHDQGLMADATDGDQEAFARLITLVYDDLRRIAHRRLQAERDGHTLNTTAVVHEAYLRLSGGKGAEFRDRAHFFAVASRVIRNVLIDYGRAHHSAKRGGGGARLPLSEQVADPRLSAFDLLALDEALSALGRHAPLLERVVECRFFGGMSVRDTAEALDVSVRTVERSWTRARAWLFTALFPEDA